MLGLGGPVENDQHKPVAFEDLVAEMRREFPGRLTVVSYAGLKFARECGIDCWDFAATLAFQHLIHDCGTEEEQQRLRDMKVGYPW
jgi:hypothetical protein